MHIAPGVDGSRFGSTRIRHGTIIHTRTRMSSRVMSQLGAHLVSGDDPGADLLDKGRHGDRCGQDKRRYRVAPPRTGKAQAQQQQEERSRSVSLSQS